MEKDVKYVQKIPERRHWRHSGVTIVNSEYISHLFLVFLLLTKYMSAVIIRPVQGRRNNI